MSLNLEISKWIMKYLEQRNKELEDQKTIMELQNIRENRQTAKRRKVKLTSFEQEINVERESWLERANTHLERRLEKAINEKNMLRSMAYHYLSKNMVCQARIRSVKAKLKKRLRRKRAQDKLQILAEASLAQHRT